jgi:hypothetical protein
MSSQRIMRVIVRDRFGQLSVHALEYLRANQDQHEVHRSRFTPEGTLTYDSLIDFFSLRYEIQLTEDDRASLAAERANNEAERFLRTMGFTYRDLKTDVMDMGAVWTRRQTGQTSLEV